MRHLARSWLSKILDTPSPRPYRPQCQQFLTQGGVVTLSEREARRNLLGSVAVVSATTVVLYRRSAS